MRLLVQRVSRAKVTIEDKITGEIGHGLVAFLGVTHDDTIKDVDYLFERVTKLRIFEDNAGKMNLSLLDTAGAILIISQFTLYADTRKGNRPGYSDAAKPELANQLYIKFIERFEQAGIAHGCGIFGADMQVDFCNNGPVTIMLESKK